MIESSRAGRVAYRDVPLYATEPIRCDIDLSDNTNLWGAPPAAQEAIRDVANGAFTRYPSAYALELKEALAAYAGVNPSRIVTGCGSDDVLDSAIRAFAEPGESLAFSAPTFTMIPVFAQINGVVPVSVPMTRSWDIDADALVATERASSTSARRTILPGRGSPRGARAAQNRPGIVILDEAYAEFAGGAGAPGGSERPCSLSARCRRHSGWRACASASGRRAGNRCRGREVARAVQGECRRRTRCLAVLAKDRAWVAARVPRRGSVASGWRTRCASWDSRRFPRRRTSFWSLSDAADVVAAYARARHRGAGIRGCRHRRRAPHHAGPGPMMESALDALGRALA